MYTKRKKSQKTNSNIQITINIQKKRKKTRNGIDALSRIDEKVLSNISSNFQRRDWL